MKYPATNRNGSAIASLRCNRLTTFRLCGRLTSFGKLDMFISHLSESLTGEPPFAQLRHQIPTKKRGMPKQPRVSAGLLLFRRGQGGLEVFLAHPGGPF